MKPTVAVIIPVYNAEATVIEALGSIDRQSFRDFIIIAVDDGSTDGSQALLNDFAASRDRVVILSHANHGAAYSRNRGIRYAQDQGIPFVAFLDADDVWHEDKLSWQMKAVELDPDAQIVLVKQEEYERIDELNAPSIDASRVRIFENLFEIVCLKDFVFHPASYLARTAIFDDRCMYDARFPCGEDFVPFLSFGYRNLKILYIDVPLYFQRSWHGSLQRGRSAAYHGYHARVAAIEDMMSSCRTDAAMTAERLAVLVKARDSYLSGMLYGARRCLPYPQAVLVAIRAFGRYCDKRSFLVEFSKTLLYPLRPA